MSDVLDDIQDVRQRAAAILGGRKLQMLEEAGMTVVQKAPEGFEMEFKVYCSECGGEATQCDGCDKWICISCQEESHLDEQGWLCDGCWEIVMEEEDDD